MFYLQHIRPVSRTCAKVSSLVSPKFLMCALSIKPHIYFFSLHLPTQHSAATRGQLHHPFVCTHIIRPAAALLTEPKTPVDTLLQLSAPGASRNRPDKQKQTNSSGNSNSSRRMLSVRVVALCGETPNLPEAALLLHACVAVWVPRCSCRGAVHILSCLTVAHCLSAPHARSHTPISAQVRPLRGPCGEYGAHGVVDIDSDASRVYDFMCQVRNEAGRLQCSGRQQVAAALPET